MIPGHGRTLPALHLVTDDDVLAAPGFPDRAREAMTAGGDVVALHLRGPRSGGRRLHDLAVELEEAAQGTGSLLVVNDRVDVALAVGLDAVHLGGRSLSVAEARRLLGDRVLVGRSTHDAPEARAAASEGADYVFYGHVYETPSHPDREGRGRDGLAEAVKETVRPVVAIGGISPERVEEVKGAGAAGVAVLGGVWRVRSPGEAVSEYISALGR